MKVGFIGLGRMGQGMAGRIIGAGHELLVTDPVPGQTSSLEEAGATAVDTPAAASQGRDVVISMLPSDGALQAVLHGDGGLIDGMDNVDEINRGEPPANPDTSPSRHRMRQPHQARKHPE